ncbi:hypothetical protein CCACVL1_04106 [Corchorus capsularis]|uniref:Transposase MuDR plant domain-containing protein n=1 Tax=Corchorus capsularis TaxID=210143 RepID=A0A1R3JUX0_COCAP|nr:hypothetical protein CCACVL1_04106 [Corchorus capsularis]
MTAMMNDEDSGLIVQKKTKTFDMNSNIRAKQFKKQPDGSIVFEEYQVFTDVKHFKAILRDYGTKEGYNFEKIKNESYRVTAKCQAEQFPWRIHASKTPDGRSFMVKTLHNKHNCIKLVKNLNANAPWIAEKLDSSLRVEPHMSYDFMAERLNTDYRVVVHQKQLYRGAGNSNGEKSGNAYVAGQFSIGSRSSTGVSCSAGYDSTVRKTKGRGTMNKNATSKSSVVEGFQGTQQSCNRI